MRRAQKRLVFLLLGLIVLLVLASFLYMLGMRRLEGIDRSFWDSLEFAAETLSTTGFGRDAHWSHPMMVIFVVLLQFIGVFLVFLIFPIYLVPYLEDRFEARIPRRANPNLRDHVIIYRYGPAVEALVDQLLQAQVPALIVETDEDAARRLQERRLDVVFTRDDSNVVDICNLMEARALVANGRDEENAGVILRVRQVGFQGDVAALVEEPLRRRPMELAGASAVYTPRHILAAALAARASEQINPRLSGIQQLGHSLELRELRIEPGSQLAGRTLRESGISDLTGAVVIGQWIGGRLHTQPDADMRLEPRGILVVLGSPEGLERLPRLVEGARTLRREGPFIVGGFGEVGKKVHELLTDAGEDVRTIDRDAREGVDIVGNVLDADQLVAAGLNDAQAVILALDSDDATLFATVIARDAAPDVPIIARVNQANNLDNIHRAGADFALSISQVSGQMLSQRLLGQEALSINPQLKILKTRAPGLAGHHPSELEIRERTQTSVVAVERDGSMLHEFGPEFRFRDGDAVYVCGSEQSVKRFTDEYGA